MIAPEVNETATTDPTVCTCGRPVGQHLPVGELGIRLYTCTQLAQCEARIKFSKLPWWRQLTQRKPVGWRPPRPVETQYRVEEEEPEEIPAD